MILQALVDLYQQLSAQGKIAPAGWAPVKVSYAIYLKEDGQIAQIACMKTQQLKGKKMVLPSRSPDSSISPFVGGNGR